MGNRRFYLDRMSGSVRKVPWSVDPGFVDDDDSSRDGHSIDAKVTDGDTDLTAITSHVVFLSPDISSYKTG